MIYLVVKKTNVGDETGQYSNFVITDIVSACRSLPKAEAIRDSYREDSKRDERVYVHEISLED